MKKLLGTVALLERLGSLDWDKVVNHHQGWRLATYMWLHAGVVHLLFNMLGLVFIGVRLEQVFGHVGVIYLLSGFGAGILSSLFNKQAISIGAFGAIFGLFGAYLSELITNWNIYTEKTGALICLLIDIAINVAIGFLLIVDRYCHLGGFITDFLLGFLLLLQPQLGLSECHDLSRRASCQAKVSGLSVQISCNYIGFADSWIHSCIGYAFPRNVTIVIIASGASCVPASRLNCEIL